MREIVDAYVRSEEKVPWYIDLLNLNLNNKDPEVARQRIDEYLRRLREENERWTDNPDFQV